MALSRGQLRQIVVFRRGDDWRLLATMVNLDARCSATRCARANKIWMDDPNVIIVPKGPILVADDFINLVFTRGIYSVFPMTAALNLGSSVRYSGIDPVGETLLSAMSRHKPQHAADRNVCHQPSARSGRSVRYSPACFASGNESASACFRIASSRRWDRRGAAARATCCIRPAG